MTQPEAQDEVDRYFDREAGYWRDVYDGSDLQSLVYAERMALASRWVDELRLPPAAPVLDLGAGGGMMTLELVGRGLQVTACDASPRMVAELQAQLERRGAGARVHAMQADAHDLPFAPASFSLVVALGVLPWLHDPARALAEIERVLQPGGRAILTADNAWRLNALTEPSENPLLGPVREVYRRAKRLRPGPPAPADAPARRHSPPEVRDLLRGAGLTLRRQATVGYGPFTVLGRRPFPGVRGISLNRRLQLMSRRRTALRRHGWHVVVLAEKPAG